MFACKNPNDVGELDEYSGFFPSFAHRRISRQFIWIENSTRSSPQAGALVLHKQQLPVVVVDQHRHRRNLQQVRPNLGTEGFDKVGDPKPEK